MPKIKTTRVQLELPDKDMERLRTLKELTKASSYSEVIKNSLIIHDRIKAIQKTDCRIFIEDSEGIERYEVIF